MKITEELLKLGYAPEVTLEAALATAKAAYERQRKHAYVSASHATAFSDICRRISILAGLRERGE